MFMTLNPITPSAVQQIFGDAKHHAKIALIRALGCGRIGMKFAGGEARICTVFQFVIV